MSGVEALSLRHPEFGSFAIARDWTDWAPPDANAFTVGKALIVDVITLIALAKIGKFGGQDSLEVD